MNPTKTVAHTEAPLRRRSTTSSSSPSGVGAPSSPRWPRDQVEARYPRLLSRCLSSGDAFPVVPSPPRIRWLHPRPSCQAPAM